MALNLILLAIFPIFYTLSLFCIEWKVYKKWLNVLILAKIYIVVKSNFVTFVLKVKLYNISELCGKIIIIWKHIYA